MKNKNEEIINDNLNDKFKEFDIDDDKNNIEENEIDNNNKSYKEEQIKEMKIGEFKEIFDPIKSAFEEQEKKDEFFKNDNLNSLVLITENKNELIENIKRSWNEQHVRVQDIKHKKIMKYPQIFQFTYFFNKNGENEIWDQKTNTFTKYTFNLDDNIEIDLGGRLQSRNTVGSGEMLFGLRFNLLKDRLFNYFNYTIGDSNQLFYEVNYLWNKDILLDYVYKKRIEEDDNDNENEDFKNDNNKDFDNNLIINKHYFTLHKVFSEKKNKISAGFYFKNSSLGLRFSQKQIFNKADSFRYNIKLDRNTLKIKNKIKQKISDKFTCESETEFNYFGYGLNIFRNRFFWKKNSGNFGLGFFYSFDGFGLELIFKYGGVLLNMPLFLWLNELDLEEVEKKGFKENIFQYVFFSGISIGINFIYKNFIQRYMKMRNNNTKAIIKEALLNERKINLKKIQENYLKCIETLEKTAEKYHNSEIEKGEKGLIIHLALYGNYNKLNNYKKDFDYLSNKIKNAKMKNILTNTDEYNIKIKIKEDKIFEDSLDIENEIVDVTQTIRNRITSNTKSAYSSILFREYSKSNIFGIYNPIFKTDDSPHILIAYEIHGQLKTVLKSDTDIFQIPDDFSS